MGVIAAVNEYLGDHAEYFAVFGALWVALMVVKFTCSVWDGVKTFFLSGPLGLSVNLKKMGEWAVVTGATDGMGKAYAEELAKIGLNIVLISRNKGKLDAVASEIVAKTEVKTKCIVNDFTAGAVSCDSIKQGLAGLEIGILVNNVGIQYKHQMLFGELESNEWCSGFLNVNCHSVVMMTHLILPQMVRRRRGVIINNASGIAFTPSPFYTLYSASKVFVDFFSRGLEQEYKSRGIIVQTLMPFAVATNMNPFRPNLLVASATGYAKSSLKAVGLQGRTYGCVSHAVLGFIISMLPEWLEAKIKFYVFREGRKSALEQLQKKSQTKNE